MIIIILGSIIVINDDATDQDVGGGDYDNDADHYIRVLEGAGMINVTPPSPPITHSPLPIPNPTPPHPLIPHQWMRLGGQMPSACQFSNQGALGFMKVA